MTSRKPQAGVPWRLYATRSRRKFPTFTEEPDVCRTIYRFKGCVAGEVVARLLWIAFRLISMETMQS